MRTLFAAASVVALSVGSAQAATEFFFDLERGGQPTISGDRNTLVFNTDGLEATFDGGAFWNIGYTGDTITSGNRVDARSLNRYGLGAGIYSERARSDQHTVDGVRAREFVEMSFAYGGEAVSVELKSIQFGYIAQYYRGTNSSFEIIADMTSDGTINVNDMRVLSGNAAALVDVSAAEIMGETIGIMAGNRGSWKLKGVTVEYTPSSEVEVVPLPAAGWLLLGGLGGLVAMRSRKKS